MSRREAEAIRDLITRSGLVVEGTTGGDRLGRYRITGHLGAGGMGEILQVRDDALGREIAAKVIRGAARGAALTKLIREARITGQLAHPNIVPLYELGLTPDNRVYFTMKRVEGLDLAELLDQERAAERLHAGAGPSAVAARTRYLLKMLGVFTRVCDAISFAHSRGVIHRDLKPANVMIGRFGEVQVMDWGLARETGQPDTAARACTLDLGEGPLAELAQRTGPLRTLDGAVVGTPAYMPPEQARGETSRLDRRADIYALGAMLYEILTLRPPFESPRLWVVLKQVIEGQRIPPSARAPERGIPWELEAVVDRAMAARPEDRYQEAADLKAQIEAYLEGRMLEGVAYSSWQAVGKWARRHKAAALAALGVGLAVLLGFAATYWQMRRAQANERTANVARAAEARERRRVAERERRLAARVRDFESMSDVKLIEELRDRRADLGPQGYKLKALRRWLRQAEQMRGRLPRHEAVVARLEGQAERSEAEQWQLGLVKRLVHQLRAFVGRIPEVARWAQAAERSAGSVPADPSRWRAAIAAIRRTPRYGGLLLKPQEGLQPLGPDRASGLWEFAHLPSGTRPVRGRDGRWEITGQTAVVLVLLPGGRFRMGASDGDEPLDNEQPAHVVTLGPFFVSKYELTQGQWQRLTGKNPSRYGPRHPRPRGHRDPLSLANPVEQVSWHDCRSALARVGLRLPTEAQWEYAARAGTRTSWWTELGRLKEAGNMADRTLKNAARQFPAEPWSDGYVVHAPVGRFLPNPFGLHDVVGNLYEWCRDPLVEDAYRRLPAREPDGWRAYGKPGLSAPRVARGGAWNGPAIEVRSAYRNGFAPGARNLHIGVRPVRRLIR